MIFSVQQLLSNAASDYKTMICPLTTNKREAIEYAAKLANEYDDCVIAQRYDGEDYTAFVGNTWTTVVTPVYNNDKKYYEVVKAAINEERFYLPDDYQTTSLLSAVDYINYNDIDYDKLSLYVIDSCGNIFIGKKKIKPSTDFALPQTQFFSKKIKLPLFPLQEHLVKNVVWSAFNNMPYINLILLTSHIAQYQAKMLKTTTPDKLDILSLRNDGWQWAVSTVNGNENDCALINLQFCTLHTYLKLIDIRRELAHIF